MEKDDHENVYNLGSYLPIYKEHEYVHPVPASGYIADSKELPAMLEEQPYVGSIGVDKTRIRVPLHPDSFTPYKYLGKQCLHRLPIPGLPDVRVGIDPHEFSLAIDFNPSRFVWDQGLQLCPFSMLLPITERVIQRAINEIDPTARLLCQLDSNTGELMSEYPDGLSSNVTVSMLHLTADMVINHPKFKMTQLVGLVPKRSRKSILYLDKEGTIETVTHKVSKKCTRHSFYNKSQERKENPNPEAPIIGARTFRYEAQVPRKQLNKGGLGTLDRCTESNLKKRFLFEWENSRLGSDLVWEGEMISVIDEAGFSQARSREITGYVLAAENGVENNGYSEIEIEKIESDLAAVRYDKKVSLLKQGPAYGRLSIEKLGITDPIKANYRISRPRKIAV
jgi:hypothetical protein